LLLNVSDQGPALEPPSCELSFLVLHYSFMTIYLFFSWLIVVIGDENIQFTPSKAPEKPAERTAVQRKRKLVIDEKLELPTATIRAHIQDFSNLVREVHTSFKKIFCLPFPILILFVFFLEATFSALKQKTGHGAAAGN
jgi:hypothetical protein